MQGLLTKRVALIAVGLLIFLASACGGSWIRVQNVSDSPASVTVTYLDKDGQTVSRDTRELAPGAAENFPMSGNDDLPRGYRGSALIESDRAVVALRRIDASGDSGDMVDGDTISALSAGNKLFLPLVMSHAAPFDSWNSTVHVQNLNSASPACVTLTYISLETGAEIAWDPAKPDTRARQAGCSNGGRQISPGGTLTRDQDNYGVPAGFAGAVRIDTSVPDGGSRSDQAAIAATVDLRNGPFNLLSSYRGLTASELGTSVTLPIIEREVGPDASYNTYFQMQSSSSSPVQVQVHIEGVDANGAYVSKNSSVSFTGTKRCEQVANDGANCLAPGDALPFGFSGYATLTASAPIGVIVERGSYFGSYGSYRGIVPSGANTRVALPAVNRGSWIRIVPADGGSANLRVRYFGMGGQGVIAESASVGIDGSITLFQSDEAALPDGFDGSAIIEADRPIVAVVSYDVGGGGDKGMLYDGVAIP